MTVETLKEGDLVRIRETRIRWARWDIGIVVKQDEKEPLYYHVQCGNRPAKKVRISRIEKLSHDP